MQDAARRALSHYCSVLGGVADGLNLKYYPRRPSVAKAEAAPAKAEEKPAEAAPAAKPARKTATRKKTTKASK